MNIEITKDARIRELEELLRWALTRIAELEARVEELEQQLAQNSRNSSKPPSSDGPRKPEKKPNPKSSRVKGQRKSGGQSGHQGTTLKRSQQIDRIEIIAAPESCTCGESLQDVEGCLGEVRQVQDIPPIPHFEVTDHRLEEKTCPCCRRVNRSPFPEHVSAQVCYGPRIQALAAYCRIYQLIPSARTCELIADIFGIRISEGTLANILQHIDTKVTPSVVAIAEEMKHAELLHADETGLRVEGKRQWLHVACNDKLTHYGVHPKRGFEAMDAIGILPEFQGRMIHDYWRPYYHYTNCSHGLCNVHHLRDLIFVNEELGKKWGKKMHTCLLDMHRAVENAKRLGQVRLSGGTISALLQRYQKIIEPAYREEPPLKPPTRKKRGRPKKGKSYRLL